MSNNKKRKTSEVEFEYAGIEKERDVPKDVTIVRVQLSVTEVSNSMFAECEHLKEVILNDGLKKIGQSSFSYCSELEHINFPSTLVEIDGSSFHSCNSLKGVVLNEGLRKIGDSSFWRCNSLEHITIPSTVRVISGRAFCWCNNLRGVILNEGLRMIGRSAFAACTSLESISIPSTVTEIGQCIFYDCQRLREVRLHKGIQKIGVDAFNGCSSLERFSFPKLSTRLDAIIQAGKYVDVEDKVEEIRGIVERRGSELFASVESMGIACNNWKPIRVVLGRIDRLITYYELREATTLLELAMWKSKIDQTEEKSINRNEYRIDIPGPVKHIILQYLNFEYALFNRY